MKRFFLNLFLILLPVSALAANSSVNIGGKEFIISIPEGYVDACGKNIEIKKIFMTTESPGTSLKECFLATSDYEKFPEIDEYSTNPALRLLTFDSFENEYVDNSYFKILKKRIIEEQGSFRNGVPLELRQKMTLVLEGQVKKHNKLTNDSWNASLNEIFSLGVVRSTEHNIVYAVLKEYELSKNSEIELFYQISIGNIVNKAGKILLLIVDKELSKDNDINQSIKLANDWGEQIQVK